MKSFQKLPPQFQCAEVKEYYDILCKKQGSFVLKRILDIFASMPNIADVVPFSKADNSFPNITGKTKRNTSIKM